MIRNKMKESKPQAFRIRLELCERLDIYSQESMIPKTSIVEVALKEYLDKVAPITENDNSD